MTARRSRCRRRRRGSEIPCRREILRGEFENSIKAPPHNSAARLAMPFPPSAACKFLDLPPVNLRNLHLHLTKKFIRQPTTSFVRCYLKIERARQRKGWRARLHLRTIDDA